MLFRGEALQNKLDNLHGDVIVTPSVSVATTLLLLTVIVTAIVFWLFSTEYARKETVVGWLEPNSGIQRVFSGAYSGTVEKIFIQEAQSVVGGEPLFLIANNKVLRNGDYLESELLREYETQKQDIETRIIRENKTKSIEFNRLETQALKLQQEIQQLDLQIATQREIVDLVTQREKKYANLQTPGYIAKEQVFNVREQKLNTKFSYQALMRTKVSLQRALSELYYQLEMLPEQHKNTIAQLNQQLSSINQNILKLSGEQQYVVKASTPGVVSHIQTHLGEMVLQNKPLAVISPHNEVLIANLYIPVRAAGFLKPGQSINIRYDAFPYQKFGLYSGKIQTVSKSVLLPTEINHAHFSFQEPVYQVKAILDNNSIRAFNQTVKLKSGMTLSADIVLDNRNLVEWLLEPILSIKGRL